MGFWGEEGRTFVILGVLDGVVGRSLEVVVNSRGSSGGSLLSWYIGGSVNLTLSNNRRSGNDLGLSDN